MGCMMQGLFALSTAKYINVTAQAELALHKREAAARDSSKARGRAGGDSRLAQSSAVEGVEAGLQAEVEAANEKLATAQREAEELSTSLAKASSFIEVHYSPIT